MILVADSSALIALSICNGLNFLDALFGEVVVPQAVFDEITHDTHHVESTKLKNYLADKIRHVDLSAYIFLDGFADAGETEAMLLYKQLSADRLLIDDKRGRKVAKINHINTVGSLGIILLAKQAGLIGEVKPFLRQLFDSQIYISSDLVKIVLNLANEGDTL
ncbi:MAG: DUF3368 domain-containing protein [Methylococcales bacterium]|jgi:predicted nucleic acid-binding protein|nr:DUF3368 domain-containing protein [Methylococcales bacterium]